MKQNQSVQAYLRDWAGDDELRCDVETTINLLLKGTQSIAETASLGPLAGDLSGDCGGRNEDGDVQKNFDVKAHEILMEASSKGPVGVVGSEESVNVINLDPASPLAVVMDPLDGSSNIETNSPIGTIFSIYEIPKGALLQSAVLQPGTQQLAAAYVIYGTHTCLVITVGEGTHFFTLDPKSQIYHLSRKKLKIPNISKEYAINASNQRCWDTPIQNYIQDCMSGNNDQKQHFNMRWVASLVAEAHRIFGRGGIFLYPRDTRQGYEKGRLRLVYEANPMAFLMEQAGGAATDGVQRIMDIKPTSLHERTPLIMGSTKNVGQVADYYTKRS